MISRSTPDGTDRPTGTGPELPDGLRLSLAGPVATLVLDRPATRNAMTLAMWRAVPVVAAAVAAQPRVRVLLVRGAGGGPFCAGADIGEFVARRSGPDAAGYTAAVLAAGQALAGLSKPTVAMITGACVGGGCELALSCDLRVAGADARFGITPARLGVVYNQTSTAALVAAVGAPWARYLLMTGDLIDAATALRIGLVHQVHPAGTAGDAAWELARRLAGRAPVSVAAAKRLVGRAAAGPVAEDDWARRWYDRSYASAEYAEGVAAFLARREPDFTAVPWPEVAADGAPPVPDGPA